MPLQLPRLPSRRRCRPLACAYRWHCRSSWRLLDRPLAGDWPYLWLDATYLKQREGGRIVSVAAIIAVAANTEGRRQIVGLHIGPSEAEIFWSTFLKSMVRRGLRGVKLVISDAHEGLKAAIRRVVGASWQRCRVGLLKKPPFYAWFREGQAAIAVNEKNMAKGGVCAARRRSEVFYPTRIGQEERRPAA